MTEHVQIEGGATVLVEPSHAIPLVAITVALRSGSAYDPPGREGLFRTTLRMLRRGAEGMTAREIEDALDRLGGEIGADVTPSSAAVHGQVIGRNLDAYVDLVARLIALPSFPDDELARLRREAAAELVEVRDHDSALAMRAFRRALFGSHPYGRSTSGSLASVERLGRDEVRALHAAHMTKGNLVVGFAGDVTTERAVELARRIVARLPDGPAQPDPVAEPPPLASGRRLVFVDKPDRTQTQIVIGSLGSSPHDEDHVALNVANAVFGGTFTSRLMKEVRSKRGWSYGASSRLALSRHRSSFSMGTFPAAVDAPACITLELGLLETLVSSGITARELSFIKKYLVRSYAFEIDTATKRLHQALDVALLSLPADYYAGYVGHVEAVTLEQANAALARRLAPANLVVSVVGTASQILDGVGAAIGEPAVEIVPFERVTAE